MKFFLSLFTAIALALSVSATPIHDAPQMGSHDLYCSITNTFTSVGLPSPGPLVRDHVYISPSLAWLKRFAEYDKTHVKKYVKEAWDCDDFALTAMERACDPDKNPHGSYGITVGTAQVFIRNKFMDWPADIEARHMLNIVLLDNGDWYFYEPQTGKYERADEPIRNGAVVVEFILI